jgi:radical SAM superfamily enzyme YgiQ (UPF0313 family)
MRVLFSPAYQLALDPKQAANREPYPPLGTLYAAARLREEGHEVALSDLMLSQGLDEYRHALVGFRPDLVAIYEDDFNYLSKMCLTDVRGAAFEKARLAKETGANVVAHGSDATDQVDEYLRNHFDFVVLGEGEQTLAELVSSLSSSRTALPSAMAIAGLGYLGDGKLVRTQPRAITQDLDRLPFPAWELLDVERYRIAWHDRHDFFSLNMVTTRGCPYHCNWCAKPIYGQRYNVRSPGNVAEELAWVRENLRPDHIWFADDIFGLQPGWVEEFASEVARRSIRTPYKIQSRADLIDDRVANALQSSGCENVWIGAESGSQKVLDAMEKGIQVGQIFDATNRLRARGIRVSFFLQFGYPGEDWSDIQKTLGMVRQARPDDIGISVSYPLPGTPFFERVRDDLSAKSNWTDSDDLDLMFQGTYSRHFYRALYRWVHSDFRLRRDLRHVPKALAALRSTAELGRWIFSRAEVMVHARAR